MISQRYPHLLIKTVFLTKRKTPCHAKQSHKQSKAQRIRIIWLGIVKVVYKKKGKSDTAMNSNKRNMRMRSEPSPTITTTRNPLDRMMFKLVPRLENSSMHLLHSVPKFDSKPTQDIFLPCIVLGVHTSLNLFIINHTHSKRAFCRRRIKRPARTLDLCQELLP